MKAVTVTNEQLEQGIIVEKTAIRNLERSRIRLIRGKKDPIFVLVGKRDASVVKQSAGSKKPIFFVDRVGLSRWQTDSGDWRYQLVIERSDRYSQDDSVLIRLIIDSGTEDSCKIHFDPMVEMISVQTYSGRESARKFTRSEALAVLKPGQSLFAERHGGGIDYPYGMISNVDGQIEVAWERSREDLPAQLCNA